MRVIDGFLFALRIGVVLLEVLLRAWSPLPASFNVECAFHWSDEGEEYLTCDATPS